MGHWGYVGTLLCAAIGVLAFLAIVADELRGVERAIELRRRVEEDRRVRKAAQEAAG